MLLLSEIRMVSDTEIGISKLMHSLHRLMLSLLRPSHHQFFVQKEHQLMWCKVPKAASTSWLYAFLDLAHVPRSQVFRDIL